MIRTVDPSATAGGAAFPMVRLHEPYGEVARVMDGLKGSGADPIGLQLDDLN
jgi:hypothetical protein